VPGVAEVDHALLPASLSPPQRTRSSLGEAVSACSNVPDHRHVGAVTAPSTLVTLRGGITHPCHTADGSPAPEQIGFRDVVARAGAIVGRVVVDHEKGRLPFQGRTEMPSE
jgi:hypothetical protein